MRTIRFHNRKNRNRRRLPTGTAPRSRAIAPSSVTFSTPSVVLLFDRPIVLSGIPLIETSTGKFPTAAVTTDLHTVTLTYNTPGAPTGVTILANDPAIRGFDGSYVTPGVYSFPV